MRRFGCSRILRRVWVGVNNNSYNKLLTLHDVQFSIELRLETIFALDRTTDHWYNHELGASLPADSHGRVDVDADCEGRLKGWET